MPRSLEARAVLRTFLASPGDVAAERAAAGQVVEELNLAWSRFLGLSLELVRWETHAWPGADVDPQALINRQIGDEYELFIGIMWSRLGTATHRADSGTEEEFERAYARHVVDRGSVRIMFYFKSAPPPADAEPAQLAKVAEFRERIEREGVLSWPFEDEQTFASLLRLHLSRQVQDFCGRRPAAFAGPGWLARSAAMYRLLPPLYVDGFRVPSRMRELTRHERRLAVVYRRVLHEMDALDLAAPDAAERMRAIDRALAADLLRLAEQARPAVAALDRSYERYMTALARAAPLLAGWSGRAVRNLILRQLRRLGPVAESSIASNRQARDTTATLGPHNPELRAAAAVMAQYYDEVIAVWTRALRLLNEAERAYAASDSAWG